MKKIAIMTAGGDCAGLNSAIKAIVMTANTHGIETIGVTDGYIGFVEGNYIPLTIDTVRNIEIQGGTMLGSSNKECPFHYYNKKTGGFDDRTDEGIKKLRAQGVEGMVVVGGDGTLDSARVIFEHGMPTVGIPKTIDNDMSASEPTIGFQTAIEAAVEAIRRLITTAYSHRRVMVVELMGRTSGYLTLYAGFAAGADIILLPEIPYDIDMVVEALERRNKQGKRFSILAVAEGAISKEDAALSKKELKQKRKNSPYPSISYEIGEEIGKRTGQEIRVTIPGHTQRGGSPVPYDRVLSSRFGAAAAKLIMNGEFGYMVGMKNGEVVKVPLEEVAGKLKVVDKDSSIIREAKLMGISFGD